MISVILPSRKRWDMLMRSLTSLDLTRRGPHWSVEYLVAHDPDDQAPEGPWPAGTRFVRAPERWGYEHLECYYNALAALAQGNWLFIWNDDAVMLTEGWDEVVHSQSSPAHLFPSLDGPDHCNGFPIFPTSWARHLGHVSLGIFVDSWMQFLAENLDVQRRVPIQISHVTPHDQTWMEGRGTNPTNGDVLNTLLAEDLQKLGYFLGKMG